MQVIETQGLYAQGCPATTGRIEAGRDNGFECARLVCFSQLVPGLLSNGRATDPDRGLLSASNTHRRGAHHDFLGRLVLEDGRRTSALDPLEQLLEEGRRPTQLRNRDSAGLIDRSSHTVLLCTCDTCSVM
jgi:hypothetical protein